MLCHVSFSFHTGEPLLPPLSLFIHARPNKRLDVFIGKGLRGRSALFYVCIGAPGGAGLALDIWKTAIQGQHRFSSN